MQVVGHQTKEILLIIKMYTVFNPKNLIILKILFLYLVFSEKTKIFDYILVTYYPKKVSKNIKINQKN